MTTYDSDVSAALLHNALRGNAMFSAVSAFVLLLGGTQLADWIGVPTAIVYLLGVGLLPWAAFAWWASRSLARWAAMAVIAGDIAWVVGAIIVVLGMSDEMTPQGVWGLVVVSVAVAAFGIVQTIGLRRLDDA